MKRKKTIPKLKNAPLRSQSTKHSLRNTLFFGIGVLSGSIILVLCASLLLFLYTKRYENRVYPGILVGNIPVGNRTKEEISALWLAKNSHFKDISFTFSYEDIHATLSGSALELGFDATTSAIQAISVGRTGNFFSDLYNKYLAWKAGINLPPLFQWNKQIMEDTFTSLSEQIDIPAENALFEFAHGRVTAFKPAKSGRMMDIPTLEKRFVEQLQIISTSKEAPNMHVFFAIPVNPEEPLVKTDEANDLGIRELIGHGESFFKGSIAGRVHNVALAAARVNGVLIPPGKVFSFNTIIGDISAATGYKQAYVIKSGRTVLDDGGGVCQVSTTLFRAALNSGLPIVERHAHSYRVGYYEQGGWKPGFDATVYAPNFDLKIKNDTQHHILIQAKTNTKNLSLVFELYGTKDQRNIDVSAVKLWDSKPAPPDLYQDDPTLRSGEVKQVDWANAGIKATFHYEVTKNGETTFEKDFFSNYVPWQAVYLRGTSPT